MTTVSNKTAYHGVVFLDRPKDKNRLKPGTFLYGQVIESMSSVNYNFPSTTIISSLQLSYLFHELTFPGGAPHGGQDFGHYLSLIFLFMACSAR